MPWMPLLLRFLTWGLALLALGLAAGGSFTW